MHTASNTGKTTFYLTDALGSVLASFNNVAQSAAIKGNPCDVQGSINTAKGFTGQYTDSFTVQIVTSDENSYN